ncbi:MAG: hypothetical protein FJ020_03850 [Chloroflexi bacterium]|nr:hypothetical protein [Chloroflexota bacterium]
MTSPNPAERAFPTDSEFESLFGAQIAAATRMLAGHAGGICQSCRGECCRRIECEFYSDRFDCCPIHGYRPVKCRFYYCEKILENETLSDEARWLLNRPARELSDRLREDQGLRVFIEPPVRIGGRSWLARFGIEDEVAGIVRAVSKGALSAEAGTAGLAELVRQCRERPSGSVDDR